MRSSPTLSLLFLLVLGSCQDGTRGMGSGPDPYWPEPMEGAARKVLIVGWDGVRPDVLRLVPTPNLDALAASGTFSEEARTARPTVSGPDWSSMLTGVWPEKHQVVSNDLSPNAYRRYPDVFTRLESVRSELATFVAVDWLPLVSQESGGPLLGDAIDTKVALDGYALGWLEADSASVAAAVGVLGEGNPDALFVYIGAPDEISHEIGGIGDEYRQAIATADRQLGLLLDAVRSRPTFPSENWLILVATDHGRTESGGHGGDTPEESTVFFLASGPSALKGVPVDPPSVVDVTATALAHLGIEAREDWALDGRIVGLAGGAPVRSRVRTDTLRVLAYNTHHGEGLDGVLDLDRIGRLIADENPHLVALQEIDREVERTGRVDQPRVYGSLTGLEPLFGGFMEYQGGEYGMALLSALPVLGWTNHRLTPGTEPRTSVTARVRVPATGRELVVSGIHFYRTEEERLRQAMDLAGLLGSDTVPVILAGDFNSQPGSPVLRFLEEEGWAAPFKAGSPLTFPADGPEREIDFILLRPPARFRVLDYRVLEEEEASDHRPILMVLEVG